MSVAQQQRHNWGRPKVKSVLDLDWKSLAHKLDLKLYFIYLPGVLHIAYESTGYSEDICTLSPLFGVKTKLTERSYFSSNTRYKQF